MNCIPLTKFTGHSRRESNLGAAISLSRVRQSRFFSRSGIYRVAHFAHMSKRANPKCELYHPGLRIVQPMPDQGHGTGRPGEPRNIVSTPYIAIKLESQTTGP